MILSMKPPYHITPKILKIVSSISEKIGEVNANFLSIPSPQLRKKNIVKTIYSSLKIEGNTLSEDQVTALIENKKIIGPKKDVLEVLNAIKVYENLKKYNPFSYKSLLKAHKDLMNGLIENPGKYRNQNVGIFKGKVATFVPPSFKRVPELIENLFNYLKSKDELELIKSCVFHYEFEFIHPFLDGNGRMGRLWQTLILTKYHHIFESLPFESLISQTQKDYYEALAISDKVGNSTLFIEYMLGVIDNSLNNLLNYKNRIITEKDRLEYFVNQTNEEFTRKDYMNIFKDISSATASRDLKRGVELKLFIKSGNKNKTVYKKA